MKNTPINDIAPLFFNVMRIVREKISGHGNINHLSLVQFKILSFIADKKSPTMKEIAQSLLITLPSATVAINRMVGDGQLVRSADKDDRRIVRLEITGKGKIVFQECQKNLMEKMKELLGVLNTREINNFAHILQQIVTSYNQ